MKKNTFLFFFVTVVCISVNAQVQFWGMTTRGGASSNGNIFQLSPSESSVNSVAEFNGLNGSAPYGSLIQSTDGNIYGMTRSGGRTANGNIFKCTPSGTITSIAEFNDSNGGTPYGDLIQGTDGNLYGMTTYGGTYGYGTIFQCTPQGVINPLVAFIGSDGQYPNGNLIQGTDGNLYGMTTYGGGYGDSGEIFMCTTAGIMTVLDTFNSVDGGYPNGSLIQATDGNLYGMAMFGGSSDSGVIFKCTTKGVLTTLVNFNSATGGYPYGSLIQGIDGNLYGMTETGGTSGGGTIFKCTTSGVLTTILNFSSITGENPLGSLIQASDSSLYGMTSSGGSSGGGTIFKCTTSGTLTTLSNLAGVIYACDPVRQYGSLVEVNPVLGVNNITTSESITAYPNPAGNILNLSFNIQGAAKNANITIIDISGKELLTANSAISNGSTLSINVSGLSQGMYFARVFTDTNTEVFKFIKN